MSAQLQIDYRPTDSLIPYASNAKQHEPKQIDMIAASIKEFGFNNPVLLDGESGIVAGHGRLEAAKKLGLDEVPTIELSHLSEAQKKAYILADNRLAEVHTSWDFDMLSVELEGLQEMDFDIDLTGFDDGFILNAPEDGLTDDDEVPEVPDDPVTVLGDVWVCGQHRVMCGDSTDIRALELLSANVSPDLVFTDPPYGMSYGGGRARGNHALNEKGGVLIKSHGMILGDDKKGDELIDLVREALSGAKAISKAGSAAYICFPWRTYAEFEESLKQSGYEIGNCIVWNKKSIGLGNAKYRPQHEFIFYCKGEAWYGNKAQSDVWSMSRGATGEYVHPTQKPVELIEIALSNSSKSGDTVIDVFGGSGSTLIACEKISRNALLMELDPKYCDVIVNRYMDYTGDRNVIRESDGVLFDKAS